MMIAGYVLQSLGFILFLRNLVTGFSLTQDASASPESHLSFALIAAACSVIGAVLLVKGSAARIRASFNASIPPETHELRQKAVLTSVAMVLCILLVTITGSFSQGGTWPFLHLLVALSIYFTSFTSLVFWIKWWKRC